MSNDYVDSPENFEGLVPPPGIPNLDDADVARRLPAAVLSLALMAGGAPHSEYLTQYMADSNNVDALPLLDSFSQWAQGQASQGEPQSWIDYLLKTCQALTDRAFAAYFPDDDVPAEVQYLAGDSLLGSALLFSFLADIHLIAEDDETRWLNLWMFLIMREFFLDDEADDVDDEKSAQPQPEASEAVQW